MILEQRAHGIAQQCREMTGKRSNNQQFWLIERFRFAKMHKFAKRFVDGGLFADIDVATIDHHPFDVPFRFVIAAHQPRKQLTIGGDGARHRCITQGTVGMRKGFFHHAGPKYRGR